MFDMIYLIAACSLAMVSAIEPEDTDRRVEAIWAEPGMIANPVAFTIDRFGRVFVVESARAGNAVTDTRQLGKLNGVEEDLQLHSVEDRRALIQKWIDQGAYEPDYFTRTDDRVVRVFDSDDDGTADSANVFADGFNDAVDGIAAGALWLDDTFYLTDIPNLWALRDDDRDGVADERKSLAYGFGVRWCFYGHDLHGLVQGPDGRIYFSMGDRGFNITTAEGNRIVNPQTGGVFRCWPDGSELELFAQGLRNPQELAFDQWGNLFTGDNNCDSGDKARVVNVVEGADCGWRQDVQSLPSRGPWNREKIWHTYDDPKDPVRPAWTLPPVAHVGAGPSGILYYPGTGENARYDDHIFLVDFYGSGSTIHSFQMVPAGAWFSLADKGVYYKGKTVTDLAMGYDGRMYLTDWGGGWTPNPNGNVFTIENTTVTQGAGKAQVEQVQALFLNGFDSLETPELVELLAHPDQRVRLHAQYELARPDRKAGQAVAEVASDVSGAATDLARVHAIWCLRQIARTDPGVVDFIRPLIEDTNAHVRAQAIKMLGDLRDGAQAAKLVELLDDSDARVQFQAAVALGRVAYAPATGPLLALLDSNDDKDPVVRHGCAYALSLIDQPDELVSQAQPLGEGARIGAVIALRRMKDLGVLAFVEDPSPRVAAEAIRAIYDERIDQGLPALAQLLEHELDRGLLIEPVLRRALGANVLLGDAASARRLARFAAWTDVSPVWRKLALDMLLAWDQPLKREPVWGHWVDLPPRSADDARSALVSILPALEGTMGLDDELDKRIDAVRAKFAGLSNPEAMVAVIEDTAQPLAYRAALLDRLAAENPDQAVAASHALLGQPGVENAPIRIKALGLVAKAGGPQAIEAIDHALEIGSLSERQAAVRLMGESSDPDAADLLKRLILGLADGTTDSALALELIQTQGPEPTGQIGEAVSAFAGSENPMLAPATLATGGNVAAGDDLFHHNTAAQCLRCHTIDGEGGTAGPDLSMVGSRLTGAAIVESMIEPGAVIADGFGTVTLRLNDGTVVGGRLESAKPGALIVDDMGTSRTIARNDIATQTGPVSAMPAMGEVLSPGQIRDIAAYLETRFDPEQGPATSAEPKDEPVRVSGSAFFVGLMALVVGLAGVVVVIALVLAIEVVRRATAEQQEGQ